MEKYIKNICNGYTTKFNKLEEIRKQYYNTDIEKIILKIENMLEEKINNIEKYHPEFNDLDFYC